jgi:YbgC/YbaW family acyl-CoA thioester hydrolase
MRVAKEFVYLRRVHFVEADLAGILHFSNYYRIMEETETAFLRSIDLPMVGEDDGRDFGWPRVATSCEYFAPAKFDDELELALWIEELGEKKVVYRVEFRRDGGRLALGRSIGICCSWDDDGRLTSRPIPGDVRRKLEPWVRV